MPRLPSLLNKALVHQLIPEKGTMATPGPAPMSAEHPWHSPPSPQGWESGEKEEACPLPGPNPPLQLLAPLGKSGTQGAVGGPELMTMWQGAGHKDLGRSPHHQLTSET